MTSPAQRILAGARKSYGMYDKARALEATGVDLIHLEFGRPCHDTPDIIKAAAIRALNEGHVHYSDMQGEAPLRQALASKLERFNGLSLDAGSVLVTNGLTHASYAAIMAVVDPGDEVIVLEPYYPQHNGKIELAGGKVVSAPLDAANNFRLRADWIEARITARTKAIILINPANPTGRIYDHDELSALADLAIRYDLMVISDEVYENITYGKPHISIAALPGMAQRTISLFAFTKAYAMDGWRIGYAAAAPEWIRAMMLITTSDVTHVNSFIQYGALAAVTEGEAAMQAMVDSDRAKRDLVVQALNQMPGVRCPEPEGTIYAFPDISGTGLSGQALADAILTQAHVVVEAGSFYGAAGTGYLRICFGSQPTDRLVEAMARLARFMNR